jgi:hypothetical protein
MYQFSFRAFAEGMSGAAGPPEIRKKWSDRFAHQVRLLDKNAGLTRHRPVSWAGRPNRKPHGTA